MHRLQACWALTLALTLLAHRADAIVEVTTCNQLIPQGETGVLTGDLSCASQYGVRLETNATLDLGNHTLSYVASPNPEWVYWAAVHCGATENDFERGWHCRVIGAPGGTGAIVGSGSERVGISANRVEVENLIIGGFALSAINAVTLARLTDVVVSDVADCAVSASKVRVTGVSVETSGAGICARKLIKGADLSLVGNTDVGAAAGRVVSVSGLTASANGLAVGATSVRLADATLSGNGIDIAARRRPRVAPGACETSRKMLEGPEITNETWGVCSAD